MNTYPWALRAERLDEAEFLDGPVGKAHWGPGPWQDEPDVIEWRREGLPCLIVRNRLGALCGYVGMPPGHRFHGEDYDAVEDVSVHGGLTYAAACAGHICHVPQPGEPGDVWWLGFDCNHAGDLAPGLVATLRAVGARYMDHRLGEPYRDVAYVRDEVENLAQQLGPA